LDVVVINLFYEDLHELGVAYKIETNRKADECIQVKIISTAHELLLKAIPAKNAENYSFEFLLESTKYPSKGPRILLASYLSDFLSHFDSDLVSRKDAAISVVLDNLLGSSSYGSWTALVENMSELETGATLVEVANCVNILLERVLASVTGSLFIRDFAYSPSLASHFGRIDCREWKKVKALYDFNPEDDNELQFNVGDIIDIVYERYNLFFWVFVDHL
jgi:hypothetical protein